MASLSVFLILLSCYGLVHADFNPQFRPDALFSPRYSAGTGGSNYNDYNGADNSDTNAYGNTGSAPNGGDNLAAFGLGGLSGFYSSLSSELINAGNNFAGPAQEAGNAAALPANHNNNNKKKNNANVNAYVSTSPVSVASAYTPLPYQAGAAPSTNYNNANNNNANVNNYPAANAPYDNANAQGNINLADNGLLKQYGLEQLGSFFGSMVSELNNAGNSGGVNGVPSTNYGSQNTPASNYATQRPTTSAPPSTTYAQATR